MLLGISKVGVFSAVLIGVVVVVTSTYTCACGNILVETYFFGKMETIFDVVGFNKEKIENAAMDMLF